MRQAPKTVSGIPLGIYAWYVVMAGLDGNGNAVVPTFDSSGNLVTTSTPIGYSFSNITSAATTTVKSGAGVLRAIVINKPVASATITIYDNTTGSGTKIGTITLPATLTQDTDELVYDANFSTGLTIVTTGTSDITVLYR